MLEKVFRDLLSNYTASNILADALWKEISKNYSSKERHYHTVKHLEHLLNQLSSIREKIINWKVVLFSLYYHDIIYEARQTDNEEKSAHLMEKRLLSCEVPIDIIELCKKQILATKMHIWSVDEDTNYFTDADLSILGQSWEEYTQYFTSVRKEYAYYDDVVYNQGRKNVLDHFLSMERIYKTAYFHNKYEQQAKKNLLREKNTY